MAAHASAHLMFSIKCMFRFAYFLFPFIYLGILLIIIYKIHIVSYVICKEIATRCFTNIKNVIHIYMNIVLKYFVMLLKICSLLKISMIKGKLVKNIIGNYDNQLEV